MCHHACWQQHFGCWLAVLCSALACLCKRFSANPELAAAKSRLDWLGFSFQLRPPDARLPLSRSLVRLRPSQGLGKPALVRSLFVVDVLHFDADVGRGRWTVYLPVYRCARSTTLSSSHTLSLSLSLQYSRNWTEPDRPTERWTSSSYSSSGPCRMLMMVSSLLISSTLSSPDAGLESTLDLPSRTRWPFAVYLPLR